MKINSLYISSFGGIKNLKLDLSNGFNVIYGENENGKSTLMAFIKMMFYGSERGSAQISKNIRKKYTPWDSSQMAGSIDFEHKGKLYRLEREFKASNSTDKVTLYDLDLGTHQSVGADIGAKFFGLSCAAFERSVFIGQLGFPDRDAQATGEINSKLSNMVLTGDEGTSFEGVYTRLEKAKLALMSKSGRAGEYDKNLKLLGELNSRLEQAKAAHNSYQAKKEELAKTEAEIQLLQKNAEAVKSRLDAEQDIRNAEKLRKYLELKASLDSTNELLKLRDGTLIDEMYLRKLQFCISKTQGAKNKLESKNNEIATLKKSLEIASNPPENATEETANKLGEEIKALKCKKEDNENEIIMLKKEENDCTEKTAEKSGTASNILFGLVGILCAFFTVFSAIKSAPIPLIISLVALIAEVCVYLAVRASVKKKKAVAELKKNEMAQKREALSREIVKLESDIFSRNASLEAINTALQSSAAVVEKQKQMLQEALSELTLLQQAEDTEIQELLKLFGLYRSATDVEEVLNSLDEISQKAAMQKEIKQQLNFISKDLGGISYEEADRKLKEIGNNYASSEDFDSLKAHYEKLTEEIVELKSKASASIAESKALLSAAENPKEIQNQIDELKQKLLSQKEFCDTADIAMQVLTQSFAEIRRSYGSVLEKRAAEIFSGLTANKYTGMSISKTLDINVSEADVFGSREIDYLSSGTVDQAYLSLRIALAELVVGEADMLPILLDDALTQYDDGRMISAMKYLKEYSVKGQIILFTCHNAISLAAENLEANIISIKK